VQGVQDQDAVGTQAHQALRAWREEGPHRPPVLNVRHCVCVWGGGGEGFNRRVWLVVDDVRRCVGCCDRVRG
jgi:hypothetical protein